MVDAHHGRREGQAVLDTVPLDLPVEDAPVDPADVAPAAERHDDVELAADDLEHARHARTAAGAEAVEDVDKHPLAQRMFAKSSSFAR